MLDALVAHQANQPKVIAKFPTTATSSQTLWRIVPGSEHPVGLVGSLGDEVVY